MPSRPRLAAAAAAQTEYVTWDAFVAEATHGIKPFRIQFPGDDEPTELPCPTGAQMEAFGLATQTMNDAAAADAIFGEHGARIIELTAGQPFVVRAKLMARMMEHYGIQAAPEQLGE